MFGQESPLQVVPARPLYLARCLRLPEGNKMSQSILLYQGKYYLFTHEAFCENPGKQYLVSHECASLVDESGNEVECLDSTEWNITCAECGVFGIPETAPRPPVKAPQNSPADEKPRAKQQGTLFSIIKTSAVSR